MKLLGRDAVLRGLVAAALTFSGRTSFAEEAALDAVPAAALDAVPAPLPAPVRPPVLSAEKTVGEIPASGILFKDVIKVMRFNDPKVSGVELFVSEYERPLTERLARNFFSDPTQAAVTCVRTGPVTLAADIDASSMGEEVFSQARALLFKSVKVRRIYDPESETVIYVSYSQRLDKQEDENKSRFKTSICAVSVK